MQRARRLASVAVSASLAVAGLAACRSEPTVAAYLTGGNITAAKVQAVYDDAKGKLEQASSRTGASAAPARMPITPLDVVNTLVTRAVLGRAAEERNLQIPSDLTIPQYAQTIGLPADTEYVKTYAETQGLLAVIGRQSKPVDPTPEDLADVFTRLKSFGSLPPESTLDQFVKTLPQEAKGTLGSALGVRNDVKAQADKMNIRVNPRYADAAIDVYTERAQDGRALRLVVVPLTDEADAVPVTRAG